MWAVFLSYGYCNLIPRGVLPVQAGFFTPFLGGGLLAHKLGPSSSPHD